MKFFISFLVVVFIKMSSGDVFENVTLKTAKVKLNSGDYMPWIGFGTARILDYKEVKNCLDYALGAGYRHFDTAQVYRNEEEIGKALRELLPLHNLTRKDIFLTSKLDQNINTEDAGYNAVKESLKKLQTDYLDLYLIHQPASILKFDIATGPVYAKGPQNKENRIARWKELVKAKNESLVRNLGVSNFAVKHLKELLESDSGVKPAVNQIRWDPFNQPRDILNFCKKENILVEAWSSLGGVIDTENIKENLKVKEIAQKLGKTPSQILLRWPLQEGIAIIPKSKSKKHIEENIDLDFVIPEEDMKTLESFEQKRHIDLNNID